MIRQLQDTGVIVARFQVPELHPGHRHLINHVKQIHSNMLIVLGNHGGLRTNHDPLTIPERTAMIRESCNWPNLRIESLRDHPFSHDRWSDWLDELVTSKFPGHGAIMYGSRQSFLDVYSGKFKKQSVAPLDESSGTAQRAAIQPSSAMSAREAVIYNEMHRPSIAYSAADVAIVDDARERVLGITKHWFDGLWSLSGGFVDPEKDRHDEDTARRERGEEVLGVTTSDVYLKLGDRIRVDDPRYRKSKDKIFSQLFVTQFRGGSPGAGDDAKGVRWFERDELESMFVPWHQPLVARLKERWDHLRTGKSAAA